MSFVGAGVFGYRWEGYDHEQLYEMVMAGTGWSAIVEAEPAWSNYATLMSGSRERIQRLQEEVGVSWEGKAASGMGESVSPLTQWVRETVKSAEATDTSLQQITYGFSYVRNSMPEPVPVPPREGPFGGLAGAVAGMVDADSAEYRARAARQYAIELMNAYVNNNDNSLKTAGTFSEPPKLGAKAGEPTRAGGGVDGPTLGDATGGSDGGSSGGSGSVGVTSSPAISGGGTAPSQAPLPVPSVPVSTSAPTPSGPFSPVTGALTEPAADRQFGGGTLPGQGDPGSGERSGGVQDRGGLSTGGPGSGRPGSGRPGSGRAGGGGPSGGPGAGQGSGAGSRGTAGPPAAGTQGGAPGTHDRGNAIGAKGLPAEPTALRNPTPTAPRTLPAPGFGPLGTAAADDDHEHTAPDYLLGPHDDFWDDAPPVSPPVIGDDTY